LLLIIIDFLWAIGNTCKNRIEANGRPSSRPSNMLARRVENSLDPLASRPDVYWIAVPSASTEESTIETMDIAPVIREESIPRVLVAGGGNENKCIQIWHCE
jgi:hypothetical protein